MIQGKNPAIVFFVVLSVFLPLFLFTSSCCLAETIYYKDGTTAQAQIVNRTGNTIWVRDVAGSIGLDAQKIDKILNADGSPSKYDVNYTVIQIQNAIKNRNYLEAERDCSALLEVAPDNADVRYLRGMLNQKLGDTAKAIQDYNFLIIHRNADGFVFNNLGTIEAQLKRYSQAKDLFSQAVNSDPLRVEFHNNLSEVFASLKNYDQAIEEYRTVLALEPDNLVALFNLGLIYKNRGDFVEAQKQWERILAINPDDADTLQALTSLKQGKT